MLPKSTQAVSRVIFNPLAKVGVRYLSSISDSQSLTSFAVVGNGSLLKVSLAPSTPLYTKRNSFVASFGQVDSIVSTLHFPRLLARFVSRQGPFALQQFISSTPVETLISCSQSTSLTALELDGTIDWILTASNSLHSYSGESLVIVPRSRWRTRRGRPDFNHTFITGRGSVALAANGQIYTIVVREKETMLINRDSLVAYSVDANNLNAALPRPVSLLHTLEEKSTANSAWSRFKSWTSEFIWADPNKYFKVQGPTTLLVQSQGSPVDLVNAVKQSFRNQDKGAAPTKLEQQVHSLAIQTISKQNQDIIDARTSGLNGLPQDHFKIATVAQGKVMFETTENFNDFK